MGVITKKFVFQNTSFCVPFLFSWQLLDPDLGVVCGASRRVMGLMGLDLDKFLLG